MPKQQAHLEDWKLHRHHIEPSIRFLTGIVEGHPLLGTGASIRTSQLVRLDRTRMVAHTLNTRYTLGTERLT